MSGDTCSFCGKREDEARLAAGPPPLFICEDCLDLCRDIIAEELEEEKLQRQQPSRRPPAHLRALSCSFCGKSWDDVRKLIAGPTNYICDACVRRFSATSSPTS